MNCCRWVATTCSPVPEGSYERSLAGYRGLLRHSAHFSDPSFFAFQMLISLMVFHRIKTVKWMPNGNFRPPKPTPKPTPNPTPRPDTPDPKKSEKKRPISAHRYISTFSGFVYLINAFFDHFQGLNIFFLCSETCFSVKMRQTPPWDRPRDVHKKNFGSWKMDPLQGSRYGPCL